MEKHLCWYCDNMDYPDEGYCIHCGAQILKSIQPHKGGFDIREGHAITLEEELEILAENGFKIDRTENGIIIQKDSFV